MRLLAASLPNRKTAFVRSDLWRMVVLSSMTIMHLPDFKNASHSLYELLSFPRDKDSILTNNIRGLVFSLRNLSRYLSAVLVFLRLDAMSNSLRKFVSRCLWSSHSSSSLLSIYQLFIDPAGAISRTFMILSGANLF